MKRAIIVAVVLTSVACSGRVRQRVPVASALRVGLLSNRAIAELVKKERSWGLRDEALVSPDGRSRLVVVYDTIASEWPDFFGIELLRADSPAWVPVMSLWECDTGSGISLAAEWASDSSAVRLMGCTKSHRRWGSSGGQFDLLYVPDLDAFYDVAQQKAGADARGSLSNNRLNPTVVPVTGLAKAARPAPVPPAG